MKDFRFEWVKIRKSGHLFFVVLLAFVLSLGNILFSFSDASRNKHDLGSLASYAAIPHELLFPRELLQSAKAEEKMTPAQASVAELMQFETDEFAHMGGFYPATSTLFARVLLATEADHISMSRETEADLRYALFLTQFLEQRHWQEEKRENATACYFIKHGMDILFGLLPFLLFMGVSVRLQTADYDFGSDVFHATLPKRRRRTILARFAAMSALALLYFLLCIFFSLFLSRLMGRGAPVWQMPNRIMDYGQVYLSNLALIARMAMDVLLRLALVISLSLFMAQCLRTNEKTFVGAFFLLGSLSFFTQQIPALQKAFNPLYFHYLSSHLGARVRDIDPLSNRVLGVKWIAPEAPYPRGLFFLSLILIFLLLAVFLANRGQNRSNSTFIRSGKIYMNAMDGPAFGLAFEWKKLEGVLELRKGAVYLLVFTLALFAAMSLQDGEHRKRESSMDAIEAGYREIAKLEAELSIYEENLSSDKKTKSEKAKLAGQARAISSRLQHVKENTAKRAARKNSLDEKDGKSYYNSVVADINILYGIGIESGGESLYRHGLYPSRFGYELCLARNSALIERDIEPIANTIYLPTIYDEMKNRGDQYVQKIKSQVANHSFLIALFRMFEYYRLDLILLAVFLLYHGSGYVLDKEKSGGLPFLYTLPIQRGKILMDKYLAALLRSGQHLAVFLVAVLVPGLLTDGFGPWNFPIPRLLAPVANAQDGQGFAASFRFVPVGEFLLQILALLFLASAFLLALSLFLSCFVRSRLGQFLLLALILAAGTILTSLPPLAGWLAWLPFPYLNLMRIASGELLALYGMSIFSLGGAFAILSLWSGIFLSLASWRIRSEKNSL